MTIVPKRMRLSCVNISYGYISAGSDTVDNAKKYTVSHCNITIASIQLLTNSLRGPCRNICPISQQMLGIKCVVTKQHRRLSNLLRDLLVIENYY
jgi:hypothetical protein